MAGLNRKLGKKVSARTRGKYREWLRSLQDTVYGAVQWHFPFGRMILLSNLILL
jgi:hypothetical protein